MVSDALHFISESDISYAAACAAYTVAKEGLKIAKASAMPDKGTVAEREKQAVLSDEYQQAIKKLGHAEYEKIYLHLKRESRILNIDVWRSINANQRRS
tara:strand:+ start:291 stop:587 length:297 start_codon:yes stop_codon:yes gene_type:complete